MTCKEFIELLGEYLDDELNPEIVADMERHLGECGPCRAYLATYRKTKTIAAEAARIELPDEVKARLQQVLLEHLRR